MECLAYSKRLFSFFPNKKKGGEGRERKKEGKKKGKKEGKKKDRRGRKGASGETSGKEELLSYLRSGQKGLHENLTFAVNLKR